MGLGKKGMQLQQIIDSAELFSEVRFEGEINLELPKSTSFYVGKNFSKSLVTITKPNITLDFSDAIVRVDIAEPLDTDLNIFFVSSMAKNVEIKNLKLYVYLNIPATARQIVGIYIVNLWHNECNGNVKFEINY